METDDFKECIDACVASAAACEHCATACLNQKDLGDVAECIRLDRDCAEICRLAAAWMQRNGRFVPSLCEVCAIVCNACGTECAKKELPHCQICAAACRDCAEACRKLFGAAVPDSSVSIGVTG